MIIFPKMLVASAEAAEMKVPEDADSFNREEYPHFAVYCNFQIGRPILNSMSSHWSNAGVIAGISDDEIMKVTMADLMKLGAV